MIRILKLITIGILLACVALVLGYEHGSRKAAAEFEAQMRGAR